MAGAATSRRLENVDLNPAKVGVDNPTRRRREQHPFESWAELDAVASAIASRYGPMILFAAATGLRPAEWIALERRDVDREEHVVYVEHAIKLLDALNAPGPSRGHSWTLRGRQNNSISADNRKAEIAG
jgi:integrase